MKSKKLIVIVIVIALCWAMLLCSVTVIIPRLPRAVKESLICNGMPDIYVRILLGKPDGFRGSGTRNDPYYYLENGQIMTYRRKHTGIYYNYEYDFRLWIQISWVTELQIIPAKSTQENNPNILLIDSCIVQSCGRLCAT